MLFVHCRILTNISLYFLSKVLANCWTYKFKVIVFQCCTKYKALEFTFSWMGWGIVEGQGQCMELVAFCVTEWKLYFDSVLLHMEPQEATEVRTTFKLSSNESGLPFPSKSPGKRDSVTPVDSTFQNFTITLVRSSFWNSFLILPLSVSFSVAPFFLTFTVFSPFSLSKQLYLLCTH